MKVAVTGATGFLGSHLAEGLVRRGDSVRCLLRRGFSDTRWIQDLACDACAFVDYEKPETLREALKGCEAVYHVAGLVSAPDEREFYRVNHQCTLRLVEAAVGAGAEKFIHVSSLAAVGPALGGRPVDENTPAHPCNDYGKSKMLGEQEVLSRKDRIWAAVLRPPAIYGPRDKAFLEMFKLIRRGVVPQLGWKGYRFCITHVSDVVAAILSASNSARPSGEAYFVGDDAPRTHAEVGRLIAAALGGGFALTLKIPGWLLRAAGAAGSLLGSRTVNRDKIRLMLQEWTMDCSAFRRNFHWEPKIPLENGLRETAEWYRSRDWL